MKLILKRLAIILAIIVVVVIGMREWMNSRSFQLFGDISNRIETDEKVVALTFDDGPTEITSVILSILEKEDVKATFYLNGNMIERFPAETKMIIEAGHELGNHTFSHERMVFKSLETIQSEVERTSALIQVSGYEKMPTFRPPYGEKLITLPWYLSQNDIQTIMWNIEPESYPDVITSADNIKNHVIEKVEPGSIILLHVMFDDENRYSLEAVDGIITSLKEKGYKFKTVSELLKYE
ncbi:polysaccharide deacetylase family protein [Bacillus sp. 2205SS5-2]|uniref:polysaccharide deacetylase family protein n=1 Tax=Bacillus sp. 2205SS5-2 TaxID=3109031 RepID=UPI003007EA86